MHIVPDKVADAVKTTLLTGTGCINRRDEEKLFACFMADEVADAAEADMGEPAKGSVVEGLTSGAWRALAEISGKTAEELYDPLCYIENAVTDTQVPCALLHACATSLLPHALTGLHL